MRQICAFDNDKKMGLLNFFMSQLLQNIIDDFSFYYIDCITANKGIWNLQNDEYLRQIDYQVFQIAQMLQPQTRRKARESFPQFIINQIKRFKQLWKQLYQDYLKILNQGFIVQSICKPLMEQEKDVNKMSNQLKIKLYFEKNKYRKDIREMRESWFKQFQFNSITSKNKNIKDKDKKITKKIPKY